MKKVKWPKHLILQNVQDDFAMNVNLGSIGEWQIKLTLHLNLFSILKSKWYYQTHFGDSD